MLRLRFIIGMICVMCSLQAAGQTSNPFELKWKSGSAPASLNADTSVPSDATVEAEDVTLSYNRNATTGTLANPVVADTFVPEEFVPGAVSEPSADSMVGEGVLKKLPAVDISMDKKAIVTDPDPPLSEAPPVESIDNSGDRISPILPGPTRNVGVMLILTMLGLSVLVLTWAVNANRGFLQKIYRAAMNENLSALLLREQKFASLQYLYYIVYATFFINTSLFLFLISRYSAWNFGNRTAPLILFVAVLVGIYLTRHIFMRLLGTTFGIGSETTHYNFNILLYNILAGIALIPINLFLAFGPEPLRMPVIYGGLGLIGLLYLIRQLRGLNIASHLIATNVFQFFVYLCAVEILPVLVLYKYFITD